MIKPNIITIIFISSLFFNFLIIKFYKLFNFKKNEQIQDIHFGNPPRLGGLIIIFLFILCVYFQELNVNNLILFFLIIFIPSFLEDINFQIRPIIRFFCIIFSCFLLIMNLPDLPQFNFGFMNIFFNDVLFQIPFFTLALATVINGQNMIDGNNGLSGFTSVSIFVSLIILGTILNNETIIILNLIIVILIVGFLFFNFPFGKIFLGDSGSYFLGMLAGYQVIDIFAQYPELPTWSAVTILFYPTLEVMFSYFRKLIQNKSPFLPDNKHLHLKIYYLLSNGSQKERKVLYNSLVTPFLALIWMSPLALMPLSLANPHISLIILLGLICSYIFFYFAIPDPSENTQNSL